MSHATRVNIGSNRTFQKMKWQTRDVDTGVAIVSATTLLSIVTMPVVIALAMRVL